jgi:hypothetical protein
MVPAARAQQEHGSMHHPMHHHLATAAKLEIRDDPAARVMTIRLGPLNLPAHTDHMAAAQPPDFFLTIPFDGWLTAYHPAMLDAREQPVPGKLLHHVAFWNTARSDFLCPNKEEHIFGAGGEMNDWPAVPGMGYRVRAGERIRIETMVHNPTDTSHPDAYLQVRMEYRRATADSPPLRDIYPAWIDAKECADSAYDLPPGQSVKIGKITVRYSGVLLGVGGHLHDYGESLVLSNPTRNEPIAMLNSKLDPQGRIVSMPVVSWVDKGGYRIDRGDVLQVAAAYDNTTGKRLPEGAMGIVVGYFLPDRDTLMAALVRKPKK